VVIWVPRDASDHAQDPIKLDGVLPQAVSGEVCTAEQYRISIGLC
jgi:hypothetical protein